MAVDRLMDAATAMHQCLCDTVNSAIPVDDRPQRCTLIATPDFEMGVAQLEDMCRCGTAYVRIDSYVPTDEFPQAQQVATNCTPSQWALTLELGIMRCPPIGTSETLPSDAEWLAYTQRIMADAQVMRQAVFCCFGPATPNRKYLLGSWVPVGPEGLCGGGKMTIQVQIIACNECL